MWFVMFFVGLPVGAALIERAHSSSLRILPVLAISVPTPEDATSRSHSGSG
jgi:hypothetical protein